MDRYTIETLSCINDDYIIANHEIRQRDVDMVNAYIELIESSRSVSEPRPGDIIRYTDPYGTYYPHAHISILQMEKPIHVRMRMYTSAGTMRICWDSAWFLLAAAGRICRFLR